MTDHSEETKQQEVAIEEDAEEKAQPKSEIFETSIVATRMPKLNSEAGASMYDIVREHGDRLRRGEELVDRHGERLEYLEETSLQLREADRKHEDQVKQMESQNIKLENTVMTSSQETQQTVKSQTDRMLDLLGTNLGYQSQTTKQEHDLRMARLEAYSNVILKVGGTLVGSGGIIYLLIQFLMG